MDSLFLNQLRRITGKAIDDVDLNELILVHAPKNSKTKEATEKIMSDGFYCGDIHYVRFGKSSAQGKDGITLFVDKELYDELFLSSQLDVPILECVISKYEAQRSLILSTCDIVSGDLPYIVIVDEYTKTIENQYIRYVETTAKDIVDKVTQETKSINIRSIKEGYHDIKISPFDGCGCHTKEMSQKWSNVLNLKYDAIGFQIRLPFMKGYSVEVPIKKYYKSIGVTHIIDVFGVSHNVNDIDCLWNISMWKGYGIFKDKYGDNGFIEYMNALNKYDYKLGISKYSHHINNTNLKARMNFQYLQCLDLWNPKYIEWFTQKERPKYDILDSDNWGKIISLASYTTDLYEKIIKGDKFYSCKFLGFTDDEDYVTNSKYVEAVTINDIMLKDPTIKRFLHRKLKKAIDQAKYGKIYSDGFYHTCVGDMIGYLEYCAGKEPVGCLKAKEFYCDTIPKGRVLSFRSPLVCPSEVNDVNIVDNEITKQWLSHFKDQDVVMLNMYDISMPQQGGMDEDGDAIYLCHDPCLIDTKIYKSIIVDVEDKATAKVKSYTKENITEYELNSRDNRIGEITNVATAIINQYITDEKWKRINEDNVSLLRIFQGKEIDFQKTGIRWQMSKWLRKSGKKLPFFMLFRYPEKLKRYYAIQNRNRKYKLPEEKINSNAYHSPSPMNELCDYILSWEKYKIEWDNSCINSLPLILDESYGLDDKSKIKQIRHLLNDFATDWRNAVENKENGEDVNLDCLGDQYLKKFKNVESDFNTLANYCIKAAYSNISSNKSLVWHLFGDVILKNLKKNTPSQKYTKIIETKSYNPNAYEYLGKYYEMVEGVMDV